MYFPSRLHNFYSLSQSHTIHDKKNYYPDLRYTAGHLAWLLALTHLLQPLLLHHESQCIQANNPTFPLLILQPNSQSINFSHPISPFLCSTNKLIEKNTIFLLYFIHSWYSTHHFAFFLPSSPTLFLLCGDAWWWWWRITLLYTLKLYESSRRKKNPEKRRGCLSVSSTFRLP